jgi:hypothetical protein
MMPSVLPRTSKQPVALLFQTPSCMPFDTSASWRDSPMISHSTSSATLRVLLKGALNTTIPRFPAASSATWFVPMQ